MERSEIFTVTDKQPCMVVGKDRYAERTEALIMLRDIQNNRFEGPDMCLSIKDHKLFDPKSDKPVP